MTIPLQSPEDIGVAIKAIRRSLKIRQDDLAMIADVSPGFMLKLESGNPSVNLGKVLSVMAALGIELELRVPPEVRPESVLQQLGVRSGNEAAPQ